MTRRAFTLIELLVATVIFTIVLSAAWSLFDSARGLASRAELRAELFQTARAALEALEDDLRGAVLPGTAFDGEGFLGTNAGSEKEPLDRIELVSVNAHAANAKKDERKSDLSRVSYWIETGQTSGTPKRGLVRERQAVLTPVTVYARRDENIEEVAPEVVYLDFRYYDTDWRESWDSTRQYKLPRAIEASVWVQGLWREEPVLEKFTTRFYLPVGAETPERQP